MTLSITIDSLPHMTENKQQEVGQAILVALYRSKVEIDGVTVQFKEET